jgi:hypothetical protein
MVGVPNGRIRPRELAHGRILSLPIGSTLVLSRMLLPKDINIAFGAPLAYYMSNNIIMVLLIPIKTGDKRGS